MDKRTGRVSKSRASSRPERKSLRLSKKRKREKEALFGERNKKLFNHVKKASTSPIVVEKLKPNVVVKTEPCSTADSFEGDVSKESTVLLRLSEIFHVLKQRSICTKAVKSFAKVLRRFNKPRILKRELGFLSSLVQDCIDDLHTIPRDSDIIPTLNMEELLAVLRGPKEVLCKIERKKTKTLKNEFEWPNGRLAGKIKRLHEVMYRVEDEPVGWKVWLRVEERRKPLLFTLTRGDFRSRAFTEACLQRFTTRRGSNFYHYFCFYDDDIAVFAMRVCGVGKICEILALRNGTSIYTTEKVLTAIYLPLKEVLQIQLIYIYDDTLCEIRGAVEASLVLNRLISSVSNPFGPRSQLGDLGFEVARFISWELSNPDQKTKPTQLSQKPEKFQQAFEYLRSTTIASIKEFFIPKYWKKLEAIHVQYQQLRMKNPPKKPGWHKLHRYSTPSLQEWHEMKKLGLEDIITVHQLFRRLILLANGQIRAADRPPDWQIQANDDLARLYRLLLDPNMPIISMIQKDKIQNGTIGSDYWQAIIDIDTVRVWVSGDHGVERIKGIKKVPTVDDDVLEAATGPFRDLKYDKEKLFEQLMVSPETEQLSNIDDLELTQMATVLLLGYLSLIDIWNTPTVAKRHRRSKRYECFGRRRYSLRLQTPLRRSSRVLADVVLPSHCTKTRAGALRRKSRHIIRRRSAI